MANLGMIVDLSHVGDKTSEDTINYAPKPLAPRTCSPRGLEDSARNKPDRLLALCAEKGGYVGINCFGPHMPKGNESIIDDYVAASDHTISLCGQDNVGVGSDNADGHTWSRAFLDWCNKDKGYARRSTPGAKVVKPLGSLGDRPALPLAMAWAGRSEEKIRKVMGGNWLRYMEKIIGS